MKKIYWILVIIIILVIASLVFIPQEVSRGDHDFKFSTDHKSANEFQLGDTTFKVTDLMIDIDKCANKEFLQSGDAYADANQDCMYSEIEFGNLKERVYSNEVINLNDHLTMQFVPTGSYDVDLGSGQGGWASDYYFDIDPSGLKASIQVNRLILKDDGKATLNIMNSVANNLDGGVKVVYTRKILFTEKLIDIDHTFKQGDNEIVLDIPDSEIGKLTIKARPYVTILGNNIFTDAASKEYQVITSLLTPEGTEAIANGETVLQETIEEVTEDEPKSFPYYILIIIGIIILIIILVVKKKWLR